VIEQVLPDGISRSQADVFRAHASAGGDAIYDGYVPGVNRRETSTADHGRRKRCAFDPRHRYCARW
jgi:hypothetical protein